MTTLKKSLYELMFFPVQFVVSIALAWIPMLGWNLGIAVLFPTLPDINYMTAFWMCIFLSFVTTKVVPFRVTE